MTCKKNKRILEAGSIALDLNLHFSKYLYEKESSESKAIINKIGNAFNEALGQGQYQSFFTQFNSKK